MKSQWFKYLITLTLFGSAWHRNLNINPQTRPLNVVRSLMKLQWLITSLNSLTLSPDLRGKSYLSQPADPFPTDHVSLPWSASLSLFFLFLSLSVLRS
ncbi:uncharacterized protein BO88DRAFT_103281 [Aspergillus vadensis CBS 113365]|uniref:Uncharacterized protein n=1 Tax=Aspergillus vadensis (strain CBS 113365 / IMI 142717 / IBT 24658) TaxID=1448311 RepID=A0A319BPQ1_ASPVC|nr:hypothetical protein BO88DRAFT_103281 [Aspergillus vadensis CBS 113365]PYH73699.1 hypothetical protein BO88DRAFT_103281 [Aspergillus vadensis CBS 113365]